jgi:hypothetical protein
VITKIRRIIKNKNKLMCQRAANNYLSSSSSSCSKGGLGVLPVP